MLDGSIAYPQDPIIEAVLNKIKSRADVGMVKYGVSMHGNDGSTLYWLRHAQEEAMDLANYLEKLIQLEGKNDTPR